MTPTPRPGVRHGGVAPVLAATSGSGIEAAARRGLPMLLGMHADDDEKAAFVRRYGAPAPHLWAGIAHVEDSTARARQVVRDALPRWLEPGLAGYVRLDGAERTPRDAHEYTELLCGLHPVGDADHAVARLTASAEATGVEHVVLLTDCTGDPDRTRETIARLGAEVLPRLPGRGLNGAAVRLPAPSDPSQPVRVAPLTLPGAGGAH